MKPIRLHAPSFWYAPPSWQAKLLQPLASLYDFIGRFLRARITPQRVAVPVICVGNIVVGGSGKTPVVKALIPYLVQLGHRPHIISRGYGGYLKGPVRVDLATHTLGEVGDEPLLLAAHAPTWVAKDKVAGAKAAIAAGASVIVLDDGLQNPSLHKDLSLLVVDAGRAFGNEQVLPAGPMRETLHDALEKTNVIIWIGKGNDTLRAGLSRQKPLIAAKASTVATNGNIASEKFFAFCGLGHAQKFYDGLKAAGGHIIKTADFPDHYVWSTFEIRALLNEAKQLGAKPVTTAKDAVRIPPSLRSDILICDVDIHFADNALLVQQLKALKK